MYKLHFTINKDNEMNMYHKRMSEISFGYR